MKHTIKIKRDIMTEINKMNAEEKAPDLIKYATPQELETFIKVFAADPETVAAHFLKDKDDILKTFIKSWYKRKIEKVLNDALEIL